MTNVFTVHRTVCVMKCVPLEECGGARNYVGHYHIVTIDHSRHEPSNVQNAPKPPPKMWNLLKHGQNSMCNASGTSYKRIHALNVPDVDAPRDRKRTF